MGPAAAVDHDRIGSKSLFITAVVALMDFIANGSMKFILLFISIIMQETTPVEKLRRKASGMSCVVSGKGT